MLCQRSGVSLSYLARASSNCLFCLDVHEQREDVNELEAMVKRSCKMRGKLNQGRCIWIAQSVLFEVFSQLRLYIHKKRWWWWASWENKQMNIYINLDGKGYVRDVILLVKGRSMNILTKVQKHECKKWQIFSCLFIIVLPFILVCKWDSIRELLCSWMGLDPPEQKASLILDVMHTRHSSFFLWYAISLFLPSIFYTIYLFFTS